MTYAFAGARGRALLPLALVWACGASLGGALACSHDTTANDDGDDFTVHCHFDLGDATCQAAFPGKPFCNTCVDKSQNLGCVSAAPPPGCSSNGTPSDTGGDDDGDEDESSSGSTSIDPSTETLTSADTSGDGTDESTGIAYTCEEEGQLDEDCESIDASAPYCIGATCVGCNEVGGDPFCLSVDGTRPVCDPSSSVCLGCEMGGASFCGGATPVCDGTGECRGCTSHIECPGTACHIAGDDPLAGSCFTTEEVSWVDRAAICPGMGTQAAPSCSLGATLAAIPAGGNAVIALVGTVAYDENVVAVPDTTVAILGTAGVPSLVGEADVDAPSLSIDGARVYVQGVRVIGNTETHGISCEDGTLWLDASEVRENFEYGVFVAAQCDVTLRRASVHNNTGGGIRQLGGKLVLDNAVIGQNGDGTKGPGVNLQFADLTAIYASIVGNDGVGADSIQCLESTGRVRNSIVTGVADRSVDLDCFVFEFETNGIDTPSFATPESVQVEAYDDFWFIDPDAGDFRLANPPFTPFGNVARWEQGDPLVDADGTERPQGGALGYAGVDEP